MKNDANRILELAGILTESEKVDPNKVYTIELDWSTEEISPITISAIERDVKKMFPNCGVRVKQLHGPGGGWPVVSIAGKQKDIMKGFAPGKYDDGDTDWEGVVDIYLVK